jgi:hypothetical protein
MRPSKILGFITGVALVFLPLWAEACPRCVDGTPFKIGLQWAVVVLLPLPFTLGYLLYRFVRASIPPEEDGPSQG